MWDKRDIDYGELLHYQHAIAHLKDRSFNHEVFITLVHALEHYRDAVKHITNDDFDAHETDKIIDALAMARHHLGILQGNEATTILNYITGLSRRVLILYSATT